MSNARITQGYLFNDNRTVLMYVGYVPNTLSPTTGLTGITISDNGTPIDIVSASVFAPYWLIIVMDADLNKDDELTFSYSSGNILYSWNGNSYPLQDNTGTITYVPLPVANLSATFGFSAGAAIAIAGFNNDFLAGSGYSSDPSRIYDTPNGFDVAIIDSPPNISHTLVFDTFIGSRINTYDSNGYLISSTYVPPLPGSLTVST